jgi:hypothetical protein
MFAILGINLVRDKMHYCELPTTSNYTIYDLGPLDCSSIGGGVWANYQINFDNILNGMLTLFLLSTLENWPTFMYKFVDGTEEGPV